MDAVAGALRRLGARRLLAGGAASSGVGTVAWWERRRRQLLAKYAAAYERYRDSGGESRYPFYGRDFGYEVDYMIELGLEAGDRILANYLLAALPLPHAAAVAVARLSAHEAGFDDEAAVEVEFGRRMVRHAPRPGPWWRPWRPHGEATQATPYSDWLAWPGLAEVEVHRLRRPAASAEGSIGDAGGARAGGPVVMTIR